MRNILLLYILVISWNFTSNYYFDISYLGYHSGPGNFATKVWCKHTLSRLWWYRCWWGSWNMWRNFLQTNGRLKHFFCVFLRRFYIMIDPMIYLKSTWSGTRKDISISLQSISITVELTSQYNDWISIIFACQGQALRNQLKT